MYDLAHVVPGGSRTYDITCMIYSRSCFLGGTSAVQILHDISQRQVRVYLIYPIYLICLIYLIYPPCELFVYSTIITALSQRLVSK